MDLTQLTGKAMALRTQFDAAADAAGQPRWTKQDLMAGFMGDVGDLSKLVMAKAGMREIPDTDRKLGHELADCLWSILVLAELYEVDLATEFEAMIAQAARKLDSK
jgi:NTP pyrophosphatase (non-canonical NTP hydrolase)